VLKPIKNNVIVELIDSKVETLTVGGILLVSSDKDQAQFARVVAVGPDVEFIKLGDAILPDWNEVREAVYEKEKVFVVNEDVVVMIKDEPVVKKSKKAA
jgi:co-chaperonin GroES (HSP10)